MRACSTEPPSHISLKSQRAHEGSRGCPLVAGTPTRTVVQAEGAEGQQHSRPARSAPEGCPAPPRCRHHPAAVARRRAPSADAGTAAASHAPLLLLLPLRPARWRRRRHLRHPLTKPNSSPLSCLVDFIQPTPFEGSPSTTGALHESVHPLARSSKWGRRKAAAGGWPGWARPLQAGRLRAR